jgi:alanine racemase
VRQTTLEIDLGRLKGNYQCLLERAAGAELLVLLKSDAYGHSLREVSRSLESLPSQAGLHGFGVANVEEGIELRREGVRRPVYVMSGIQHYDEDMHRCLATCDLVPVISSLRVLKQLASATRRLKAAQAVHLKFNTGMNRLGIDLSELDECVRLLKRNPQIGVNGLMSHLAQAEKPASAQTRAQVTAFRSVVSCLKAAGISPQLLHLCNSAGLAAGLFPEGNLVRVGLHLYGIGDKRLKPAARWTAQVYQVRELAKGEAVGYGARFRSKRKMRMAVLGVGYGDGYRRIFSNRAEVLLRGRRCRVIGSVSMDLTAVDVSNVPSASTEDRAVLLGREGAEEITADELAFHAKSISWEILTGISPRVPRVFK